MIRSQHLGCALINTIFAQETPEAARHQADQVSQLVGASDADPDLGFMAWRLALCSLPRTNPGNPRHQYKRVNGPYRLAIVAGADKKLPFGNLPRLLLAWVCTTAVDGGRSRLPQRGTWPMIDQRGLVRGF